MRRPAAARQQAAKALGCCLGSARPRPLASSCRRAAWRNSAAERLTRRGKTNTTVTYEKICFAHKKFAHNQFFTLFFSMKMAESEKVVLVSCIIAFDDIQV